MRTCRICLVTDTLCASFGVEQVLSKEYASLLPLLPSRLASPPPAIRPPPAWPISVCRGTLCHDKERVQLAAAGRISLRGGKYWLVQTSGGGKRRDSSRWVNQRFSTTSYSDLGIRPCTTNRTRSAHSHHFVKLLRLVVVQYILASISVS